MHNSSFILFSISSFSVSSAIILSFVVFVIMPCSIAVITPEIECSTSLNLACNDCNIEDFSISSLYFSTTIFAMVSITSFCKTYSLVLANTKSSSSSFG
ncbi:MAG: hypothetical protein LUI60_00500 [Clostridia bacterium]|nr:hypothetical protein [Clostridia bacterium]